MRLAFIFLFLTGCAGTQVRQTYEINHDDNDSFSAKLEISHTF